jgi:phosphatidylserine decarboxylase
MREDGMPTESRMTTEGGRLPEGRKMPGGENLPEGGTRTEPPVSTRWRLILALLRRLPQGALSRLTGWLADRRLPRPLRGPVIGAFARGAGIDTSEAEAPPGDYPSVGAYFIRHLRPGARSWARSGAASPVDGVVGAFGTIEPGGGTLLQAKGIRYTAAEILGEEDASMWEGGRFLTIYLSPRHYHRIHTPLPARVRRARSIPGRLLPVNLPAVRSIPDLFPRNERLVVFLEPEAEPGSGGSSAATILPGPVALVAVGAFNVGRISAAFDPGWHTNRPRRERPEPELRRYDQWVGTGAELAAFHLGSTVVLLFAPGPDGTPPPPFAPGIREGVEVRLGEALQEVPPPEG